MLTSDILVLTRRGQVAPAQLGIQQIAEDLHTTARRLRVYVAEPRDVPASLVVPLVDAPADHVRRQVGVSASAS
jgi:hypothetical protein